MFFYLLMTSAVEQSVDLMPLNVRVGRFWFQRRSFSPVPLFLLLVLMPPNFVPTATQKLLLLLGILLAESIRVWAVGFAGSKTRTRGDKVDQLVHAGPYRFVRNPLYVANILLYTFCGLFFGFTYLSAFIFVYSCLQYYFIVSFEESILSTTFGASYAQFCKLVPRWLVSFKPLCPSSEHIFSLQKALRSERSTFYSMAAMTVLYLLKSNLQ